MKKQTETEPGGGRNVAETDGDDGDGRTGGRRRRTTGVGRGGGEKNDYYVHANKRRLAEAAVGVFGTRNRGDYNDIWARGRRRADAADAPKYRSLRPGTQWGSDYFLRETI